MKLRKLTFIFLAVLLLPWGSTAANGAIFQTSQAAGYGQTLFISKDALAAVVNPHMDMDYRITITGIYSFPDVFVMRSEKDGVEVGFEINLPTVSISHGRHLVASWVDIAYIDGTRPAGSLAPIRVSGRTFVPVRFIATVFQLPITYSGNTVTLGTGPAAQVMQKGQLPVGSRGEEIFVWRLTPGGNVAQRNVPTTAEIARNQMPAPLWDSPEYRNPNPVFNPSNGELRAFLESFHEKHRPNNKNPYFSAWTLPKLTAADIQLQQEFVRGFVDAASRDTFFQGMPFNMAFVETILTRYKIYFAPVSADSYFAGWASKNRREIFVSFGDKNRFAHTAIHEIGHALGLGEPLAHMLDEELLGVEYSKRNWYRSSNFDRVLLSKVNPVDFWRAAFSSNQAYAKLWNTYMSHIARFDDMQIARVVATDMLGGSAYEASAYGKDIVAVLLQEVQTTSPTIAGSPRIYRYDVIYWYGNTYLNNETVLRNLPMYFYFLHAPGLSVDNESSVRTEAIQVISKLANFGYQHNSQSVPIFMNEIFLYYSLFTDWRFPSQPGRKFIPVPGEVPAPVQPDARTLRFQIDADTFTDNGTHQYLDAAPFIQDDRTMVPLRVILEALGATDVAFDAGHITFTISGQAFSLTIGQPLPNDIGTPIIVSDRTFVPLAYVINALYGADARWCGYGRAAYIYIGN